jgi:hypothetical protein
MKIVPGMAQGPTSTGQMSPVVALRISPTWAPMVMLIRPAASGVANICIELERIPFFARDRASFPDMTTRNFPILAVRKIEEKASWISTTSAEARVPVSVPATFLR